MIKHLAPLLLLAALVSCSTASTAVPTGAPAAATPARRDLPTAAQASTSASLPSSPTAAPSAQPSASPTARPTATATPAPTAAASTPALPAFSYPIGTPGQPLGDGFFIRHGVQVENTWYNPGYWHTGEDWYRLEGDTAGAQVYAIAAGAVVYADADYPGRVVIIRHADDLYSMYGHLDPKLAVAVGQPVARGDLLGTVLRRADQTPNHLHFEMRTFLTTDAVNGASPRYPFPCGPNCPPGPGYWPISAPELPSALGWRNPTHVINQRMLTPEADAGPVLGEIVVATPPVSPSVTLWSAAPGAAAPPQSLGELALQPGDRVVLLAVHAGPEAPPTTSALSYDLWYRIALPDERSGWVQAAVPSTFETGGDGRPSSVRFNFVPASEAGP
jgi:murein DD-endopeptidase MepM/ murein hydrolase activator NlpD